MKPTQVRCAVGSLNQLPPWVEISGDVRLSPFYEVRSLQENYANLSMLCAQLVYEEPEEKETEINTSLGRDLGRCAPLAVLRGAFSTRKLCWPQPALCLACV